MSLLISSLRSFGVFLRLYINSVTFYVIRSVSLMDILSIRMLWLSVGVILALLSSNLIRRGLFLWWIMSLTLIISFISSNIFYFYIFFELSLIPILLIILSIGRQPERLSAGSYLLFYTTSVSVPYLVIILLIRVSELCVQVKSYSWRFSGLELILLVPFLIKIPLFGMHFWLPKAHVEARTRGSIVLAGILLKLGRYGASRIVCLFSIRVKSSWFSSIWIILALLSSIVTFIQRDLKKLVAYSRVTHITFILVGIITNRKLIFVRVILVSLSHGWAAIGIFARAGVLSNSVSSRLGTLISSESSLFWFLIIIGFILVSNSGIPPMPSFFPEVLLVISCISISGYSIFIFLLLRIFVCYYNAYLFLWISHIKSCILSRRKVYLVERIVLLILVIIRFESLLWIQMF